MRLIIKDNYNILVEWVAYYIMMRITRFNPTKEKPFVLGLPTGSSPIGVYKKLINYYNEGKISFTNVITFNMDEYVGLSKDHDQSYHYFMRVNFFNYIDIPEENINLLDGCAENIEEECIRYEEKIKKLGGIELFLGGVGTDGHIAFNEPGSSLNSKTRIKTLCNETILSNSKFFKNKLNLPKMALTVGISTIMNANQVLIIASGFHKAHVIKECLEGNINNNCPITVLQNHNKCIIVCDKEATSELKVKTVNYFDNLQKNTNIFGQPNSNYLNKFINKEEKILVFSPHPDDDVIGLGGTLQKFNKSLVTIVYMTDGSGGYDKEKYNYNPRKIEATLSLKILKYKESNIKFLELPFYKNKIISQQDYDIISDLLDTIKPVHIFVCQDTDPNKTHTMCYNIIKNSKFNDNLKYVWLYNSIWGTWLDGDVNCISYLDENMFNNKKLSIMIHDSQDPPKVYYDDNRPFYEKIINKNSSVLNPGYYEEQFKVMTKEEFN